MDIHFLGAATTVTGSQHLLTTDRAKVLIDCGMFQGSPNEAIRNRIPLAYDPAEIDAILLTHAHLDHCGLIPHVVNAGYRGPIYATAGTVELARLVLLDSGRLQEEFVKREERWERRHPDKAASEGREELAAYTAAMELAAEGGPEAAAEDVRGETLPTATVSAEAPVPAGSSVAAGGLAPARRPDEDAEHILRGQPPSLEVDLDEALYTEADAQAALEQFRSIEYGQERELAPGIRATFLDAGHILGSAIIRLRVQDGEKERILVFSGDLGRTGTPIIRDPTPLTAADYVLVESTYGGREHEPEQEAIRILAETVRLVAENRGVLLVPSFAIGRTQEVVWELDRLIEAGTIPQLPLYLDSPMASKASDVYRRHSDYFDDETRKLLSEGNTPLDYPDQHITNNVHESEAIARAPRPYMIVASNGMLTGGRVVGHLRALIDDPAAVLLFVGYQGKGTLGAHLQEGATQVRIDGETRPVRCQIRSISGFSAHADEPELLAWLSSFTAGKHAGDAGYPRRVFLVHGDPDAQAALEPKVTALGLDVTIPHWHERIALE